MTSAFRHRSRSFMVIAAVLTCVNLICSVASAQSWMNATSGSGTTSLNGSLLGNPVNISSSFPSGTPAAGVGLSAAPGINPPFNSYCIWDSSIPENSAQLWPASAATPGCAEQVVFGVTSVATAVNPLRVAINFVTPVINPRLMIYSFDNSAMSLAATRDFSGNPAVLGVTYNNAGIYGAAAQSFGTVGTVAIPEGCANNATPGRACAYIGFIGTYNQVVMDFNLTSGGQDGVGFMIGADATTPVSLQSFQVD